MLQGTKTAHGSDLEKVQAWFRNEREADEILDNQDGLDPQCCALIEQDDLDDFGLLCIFPRRLFVLPYFDRDTNVDGEKRRTSNDGCVYILGCPQKGSR